MALKLCIHGLRDVPALPPSVASVAASTTGREQLVTALRALSPDALLLDLDVPEATDLIVAALELRPHIGVVGAIGGADLSLVIAAQRAGCAQVVTKPIDGADLAAALARVSPQSREPREPRGGQIFALMGATGGNGVTTLACHLAVELSTLTGASTALIDLDLEFGGVARAFDLAPGMTISDLAAVERLEPDMLSRVALNVAGRVNVIPRPNSVLEVHTINETQVAALLRTAAQAFPFVVVDLPRKLDAVAGNTIESCARLLIVVQLNVPNVDNARRLIDALTQEGVPAERLELIVNRYRKGAVPFPVEMLERQLGKKVLAVVPNDYQAVSYAIDTGQPLAERNAVRTAIAELAGKLVARPEEPEPEPAPARPARKGRQREVARR
jgi:pilus assembly protein CpaE